MVRRCGTWRHAAGKKKRRLVFRPSVGADLFARTQNPGKKPGAGGCNVVARQRIDLELIGQRRDGVLQPNPPFPFFKIQIAGADCRTLRDGSRSLRFAVGKSARRGAGEHIAGETGILGVHTHFCNQFRARAARHAYPDDAALAVQFAISKAQPAAKTCRESFSRLRMLSTWPIAGVKGAVSCHGPAPSPA